MNKGTKKAAGYGMLALYVAYMALPAVVHDHPQITWLVTLSTVVGCLWRGRDYLVKGDSEDGGDKAVATLSKELDDGGESVGS